MFSGCVHVPVSWRSFNTLLESFSNFNSITTTRISIQWSLLIIGLNWREDLQKSKWRLFLFVFYSRSHADMKISPVKEGCLREENFSIRSGRGKTLWLRLAAVIWWKIPATNKSTLVSSVQLFQYQYKLYLTGLSFLYNVLIIKERFHRISY